MKALVLYDSTYGNTKAVAEIIAHALKGIRTRAVSVSNFDPADLNAGDLLVVGSPINGWRPTTKITGMLNALGKQQLQGIKAAAFDTRVRMFLHGDAATKITRRLKDCGAEIISSPHGFFVKGTEGPLRSGVQEKAVRWADSLLRVLSR